MARRDGKKVKVVGSGLSPSHIACTDGYMVTLENLNKIIEVDKEAAIVTVSPEIAYRKILRNNNSKYVIMIDIEFRGLSDLRFRKCRLGNPPTFLLSTFLIMEWK